MSLTQFFQGVAIDAPDQATGLTAAFAAKATPYSLAESEYLRENPEQAAAMGVVLETGADAAELDGLDAVSGGTSLEADSSVFEMALAALDEFVNAQDAEVEAERVDEVEAEIGVEVAAAPELETPAPAIEEPEIDPLAEMRAEYGDAAVEIVEHLAETLDMSIEDVLLTLEDQPELFIETARIMNGQGLLSDPAEIQEFENKADEVMAETGAAITMARYQEILEQEAAAAMQFTQTFKLPERNADNFKI